MKLGIIGAGGHAKVVWEAAVATGDFEVVCFVDKDKEGQSLNDIPILSELISVDCFIVAIGDNRARKRVFEEQSERGLAAATIIHPKAYIARTAVVETGSVILAGAIATPEAFIGKNCIINTLASVDHECIVESHSHVSAGVRLTGRCKVEEGALVGAGSTLIPCTTVGSWSLVGAGAVVIRDVRSGDTVVGVPARSLHRGHSDPLSKISGSD